ncbi:hypothetical protein EXIGLDRAFT_836184, partial [Exidia glandulosa HHB12029]
MSRLPRLSRVRARTRDRPGRGARHQAVARVRTRVSSLSLVSHGLSRYVGFSLSLFPSSLASRYVSHVLARVIPGFGFSVSFPHDSHRPACCFAWFASIVLIDSHVLTPLAPSVPVSHRLYTSRS